MKKQLLTMLTLASLTITSASIAQLNIPSDGSDGVFLPLTNVVIDLSQAATGSWDMNNAANAGRGVYDPEKWAIVFKFQSVVVPTNVTVSFLNHSSRAPVVWLVQSNVVIDGKVTVDGEDGDNNSSLAHVNKQGGPGGFRGSLGSGDNGLGPSDSYYSTMYGNAQILPLIGGPGDYAPKPGWSYPPLRRPGGGGAILIASQFDVLVNGQVTARAGANGYPGYGGAIKLIAQDVRGGGTFDVSVGGRFRLESVTQHLTHPSFADAFPINPGPTPVIWPPADAPKARVVSVAGQPVPAEPVAALNGNPDLTIATNQAVEVLIETRNFPIEGSVSLRVIPKYSSATWVGATLVSGSFSQALWRVQANFPSAYSAMQVRAAAP